MTSASLQHGQFFGSRELRREVDGFSLLVAAADPTRLVVRHTHQDAHFILLLDGHYVSSARGAGHLHAEPALIYNPPGTTHQDTFPDGHGRFLGVSISAARLAEISQVATLGESALRLWEPRALEAAHRLAGQIARGAALELDTLCLELASAFTRGTADERRPPGWLARAREVLYDRARDELTMAEIASEVGVHPVYLARVFRRFFGCTPADYVRHCRIERAAALVRTTTRSLAEIACMCGFVDQSHLTRAFARAFATSPGVYRRRYRAGHPD